MSSPRPNTVAFFMDGTSNSKPDPARGLAKSERGSTSVAVLSEWLPDSLPPGPAERYIRGVATDPVSGWLRPVIRAGNALGVVFGYGLTERVQEIYRRLCKHYRDGDAVFLFGFSRGACAARVLAGFVDEVGLLLESELHRVDEAWALYIRSGDADASDLREYLRDLQGGNYSRPSADNGNQLPVYFLGVWDTVAMWHTVNGVLFDPTERLVRVPSNVRHVRQAFAIHEVRRYFPELPWTELHPSVPPPASIKQVWFPGNHADVGGGYVAGEDALARHALAWMVGEAVAEGLPVHAPVSQAQLNGVTPVLVHDESHRYEPGSRWWWRPMKPFLNKVRRSTIAVRGGLSMVETSQATTPLAVSVDEGYSAWLLDGGTTMFQAELPEETRAMMVRAEDEAVQLALRQPYAREQVEPPAWIVQTTAATLRGRAREVEALLASPRNAEIDVDALATSLKFQVLLRGAEFWAGLDRTIRDAVSVQALIADADFDWLNLWWRRLDSFDRAAALAGADLPPSLKGKTILNALKEQVVTPVRLAGIRIGMRGSRHDFTVRPPLRIVPPQSL